MEPVEITDAEDERLGDYVGLNNTDDRRRLERTEFFIAEGLNVIRRLLVSPYSVRSVLLTPSRFERLAPQLRGVACPVYIADREVLARVAGFDLHRGAVASANRREHRSLDAVLRTARTVAVLEALNDAENVGAIARSARALGVDALILDPTCTDPFYRRTVRVSMGEILLLDVVRSRAWDSDLTRIVEAGFRMLSLTPAASARSVHEITRDRTDKIAIVVGAEGPGLSAATLARTEPVRIPQRADVDSLNVGHAAAIAFALLARLPVCK